MKFQKFVKSIGSEGIVYVRENGDRWLASENVFMKIPDDIRSITAEEVTDMPETIDNIIKYDYSTEPCELHKAIMPYADGVIKDCVRIFATANCLCTLAIDNSAYALIESKRDVIEMSTKYDTEEENDPVGKALVIKSPSNMIEDEVVIGLIFPIEYEE